MASKREVVKMVLRGETPPYVPWHCGFTKESLARILEHLGTDDIDTKIDNHFVKLGHSTGYVKHIGNDRYQDPFGVVWDRSIEKDIGNVEGVLFEEPTLKGYEFPDPLDDLYFKDIPTKIEKYPDTFRLYCIGFSLYERVWTMRGMQNVLMDFYDNPQFMHDLMDAVCDWNIARVKKALEYDIDGIYFGDDWGQQSGLIMGPAIWNEFIKPRVQRMYAVARDAGKFQLIHSCGNISSLLNDLHEIGVNCVNPFQPEAMDVKELLTKYRGKLSFHGGLSTQCTLSGGTPEDVAAETRMLIELGSEGNYIFAPAHAVEGDTSIENMMAFIETIKDQPGYDGPCLN